MTVRPSYINAVRKVRILLDPDLNPGLLRDRANEALDVCCEVLTEHAPTVEAKCLAAAIHPIDLGLVDQVRHTAGLPPLV